MRRQSTTDNNSSLDHVVFKEAAHTSGGGPDGNRWFEVSTKTKGKLMTNI